MKKWILLFWVLMMTAAGALADTAPVKMAVPPEAIATQAEGELEDYGLTFPAGYAAGGAQLRALCARRI